MTKEVNVVVVVIRGGQYQGHKVLGDDPVSVNIVDYDHINAGQCPMCGLGSNVHNFLGKKLWCSQCEIDWDTVDVYDKTLWG